MTPELKRLREALIADGHGPLCYQPGEPCVCSARMLRPRLVHAAAEWDQQARSARRSAEGRKGEPDAEADMGFAVGISQAAFELREIVG